MTASAEGRNSPDGLSPLKLNRKTGQSTATHRTSIAKLTGGFGQALLMATQPADELLISRMTSLAQVQEEKRRRAKKVPFRIPEGRQISKSVQAKIEARRKSREYAAAQRGRGCPKED